MNYVPPTRFNGVGWDKIYRDRYWKKEHFDAIGGHQKVFHIRNVLFFGAPFLFFCFLRYVWIRYQKSAVATKRVKLCHLLYNFKQQEKSSNNSGSIAVLDLILSFCCCREPEGPPGCTVSRGRGLSSGSRLQMALPSLAPVRRARRLRGGGRVPPGTADDQPGLHSPPATGQACRPVLQRVVEVHQASLSQILQIM